MTTDAYFWSHGEKIPLSGGNEIAVDLGAAAKAGLSPAQLEPTRQKGRELTSQLVLLDADELSESERERLESASAVHPVYRTDDETLVVVLPEVRVETSDPTKRKRLQDLVDRGPTDAVVEETKPGRLVLHPKSGRGADALELANQVVEQVHPDLAQARFLRVVRRPDLDPPRKKPSAKDANT